MPEQFKITNQTSGHNQILFIILRNPHLLPKYAHIHKHLLLKRPLCTCSTVAHWANGQHITIKHLRKGCKTPLTPSPVLWCVWASLRIPSVGLVGLAVLAMRKYIAPMRNDHTFKQMKFANARQDAININNQCIM